MTGLQRNGHSPRRERARAGAAPSRGRSADLGRRWEVRVAVSGLPMQASSVLLTRGEEVVLVDTCFPMHDSILLDGLRRFSIDPDRVTGVINTHAHLDHIGCNSLFRRAWVYTSRLDLDWGMSIYESVCSGEERRSVFRRFYPEVTDAEFDRMDEARLLQLIRWMWDPALLGDRSRYRWSEDEQLPLEGISVVPTPGHTPGHFSVAVEGVDGNYLVLGDARAFADDITGPDMPPWNYEQYRRSRAMIDQFAGILLPGHGEPFSQSPPLPGRRHSSTSRTSAPVLDEV